MKILGLEDFRSAVDFSLELLRKENEELTRKVQALTEQVEEMEEPDLSDYVREDEVNDRIESYCNDNDIPSGSYIDDEIESKVSDKVEEAIDELDISDKVEEVVKEMDKASFGDTEELKAIVKKVIKEIRFKAE